MQSFQSANAVTENNCACLGNLNKRASNYKYKKIAWKLSWDFFIEIASSFKTNVL